MAPSPIPFLPLGAPAAGSPILLDFAVCALVAAATVGLILLAL